MHRDGGLGAIRKDLDYRRANTAVRLRSTQSLRHQTFRRGAEASIIRSIKVCSSPNYPIRENPGEIPIKPLEPRVRFLKIRNQKSAKAADLSRTQEISRRRNPRRHRTHTVNYLVCGHRYRRRAWV